VDVPGSLVGFTVARVAFDGIRESPDSGFARLPSGLNRAEDEEEDGESI
jgi:hypothetical protein